MDTGRQRIMNPEVKPDGHVTVLLREAVEGLNIQPSGVYIDGTFGRGGHSREILERLGQQGRLLGIDKDPEAIEVARNLQKKDGRFAFWHGSFVDMKQALESELGTAKANGIVMDLGVSSPQLDDARRGFSFMQEGPLDMRMNLSQAETAETWLAETSEEEMVRVFKVYGEERYARRIAREVVRIRESGRIQTTTQLAELVKRVVPSREQKKHPATRVFQAIRIAVNKELDDLEKGLQVAYELLETGGRMAVISFHSLEDRIVKNFFRTKAQGEPMPKELPVPDSEIKRSMKLIGKPVFPSEAEVEMNRRARSAVLRVAEKC